MASTANQDKIDSMRKWMRENKLTTVGTLWASTLAASFAYNCARPSMKTSLRLIHARLHAQAITLAALSGVAILHRYEQHRNTTNRRNLPLHNFST